MADYTPTHTKRSMADYARFVFKLLPKGRLWRFNEDSVLYKLCSALGREFLRIDDRMFALLYERDSRRTVELLPDFERDLGLPDECLTPASSIAERQARVHAKLINTGGIHRQDYLDAASAFGFTITIDEMQPFWVGYHAVGGPAPVADQEAIFNWIVNVTIPPDDVDIYQAMKCTFEKTKPAHTNIYWNETFLPEVLKTVFQDIGTEYGFQDIGTEYVFDDI